MNEASDSDDKQMPLPNPMTVASLVLALASLPLIYITLTPYYLLTSISAVVAAQLGFRKIKRNSEAVEGNYCAEAGLWLGYALTLLLPVIASIMMPNIDKIQEKGEMTKAINHCKQIITSLILYSADSKGTFPDDDLPNARTSNEVFRQLFKVDIADNEKIFGCPMSSDGNPDGNIGEKPDFKEALKPGENHWAMTKGLNPSDAGSNPLVFESPADATWPPKWSPGPAGAKKTGRTWSGGRVIIGFLDGTVKAMPLESTTGEHVGLAPNPDGTPVFPIIPGRKLEVLDVAR